MVWMDINPNTVTAGIYPLVITLILIAVVVFLYRSMRKQVNRINPDLPHAEARDPFADDSDTAEPLRRDTPPDLRHNVPRTSSPPRAKAPRGR